MLNVYANAQAERWSAGCCPQSVGRCPEAGGVIEQLLMPQGWVQISIIDIVLSLARCIPGWVQIKIINIFLSLARWISGWAQIQIINIFLSLARRISVQAQPLTNCFLSWVSCDHWVVDLSTEILSIIIDNSQGVQWFTDFTWPTASFSHHIFS